MNVDVTREPLGTDRDGAPVYLKDIWPTEREVQQAVLHAVTSAMFTEQYADVYRVRPATVIPLRPRKRRRGGHLRLVVTEPAGSRPAPR